MSLQQSLNRDCQLTQKALDDRTTFGKFVLDLNFQNVRHQRNKSVLLYRNMRDV